MSNEITSAILNFAEKHHDFNIEDLSECLCKSMDINRSSLLWHLFKLVNSNVLIRTGRGMYAKVTKPVFLPQPADDIIEVFNLLQSNFPFAKFCIYQVKSFHHCNTIFHPTALFIWKRRGIQPKPFLIF